MSGRGIITRLAVFSSRFKHVFDHHALVARQVAAGHALGHDQPQLFFAVGQLLRARMTQAQHHERQVARLVQEPDHRREDVRQDDERRSRQEHQQPRGARIARLLGACSPSAMCRKVTSERRGDGHGRDRNAEDDDRRRPDSQAQERRLDHRLDPVVHRHAPAPGWRP